MYELLWILSMTFLDGLVALVGVFSLWMNEKLLRKILFILVAFSAGALLSGAFFHLLAESLDAISATRAFIYLFIGFILFFIVEKFLHWHHCHEGKCDVHAFSYLILFGDAFHNFIDGLIIATSFLISIPFGIVTSLLIIGHEIPQELGNFGVLVYGGFEKRKALFYSFLVQITAVVGGIVGYLIGTSVEAAIPFMLPFAAGGFIYIAASDLIPELHKEPELKKSLTSFLFFLIGIVFMLGLKFVFG